MKNKIKNNLKKWLGINEIESLVGKPEKTKGGNYFSKINSYFMDSWTPTDHSLHGKYQRLRDDFEELDNKFDELEKYLQVEFFKEEKETQVYEWASKVKTQGFRKTKTYEEIKKAKTLKESDED